MSMMMMQVATIRAGMRPAASWQVTYERQESLQNIAREDIIDAVVTTKHPDQLKKIGGRQRHRYACFCRCSNWDKQQELCLLLCVLLQLL